MRVLKVSERERGWKFRREYREERWRVGEKVGKKTEKDEKN